MSTSRSALGRVCDGYIRCETHDEADALWIRLATEGRVTEWHTDGTLGPYQVRLAIIEHPAVAPKVYAIFGMRDGALSTYACDRDDAVLALRDPACFNL